MEVEVGSVYKHFKNGYILVIALATYYKNSEVQVIYKGLNDSKIFSREINSFLENVETQNGVVPRFTLVNDNEVKEFISKSELGLIRNLIKHINKNSSNKGDFCKQDLFDNINKFHTTNLGIERIKKNIKLSENVNVIEFCKTKILDKSSNIYKLGKNWYCENADIKITINAYNYSIITASKIKK